MRKISFKKNEGYTLIEMLVYIALLSVIIIFIFNLISFIFTVNSKIISLTQVNSDAYNAMERISYEMQNAEYIYMPTSNFLNYNYDISKSQQLSLVTMSNVTSLQEDTAYFDFYMENGTIFLKKDGTDPIALTSSGVTVTNFNVYYYKNYERESVKVDFTIKSNSSLVSDSSIHVINTIALRS